MKSARFLVLKERLAPYYKAQSQSTPGIGWISFIRQSLNMTLAQLSTRMGMSKQALSAMEKREIEGNITLKSLREAAKALDMKLVYSIIPKENNIETYLEEAAAKTARKIVLRTHQNMKLEGQENEQHIIEKAITDMTEELKRNIDRSIWA